ncbi:hypothetical protein GTZ99_09265 [Novosphingobium sp. FSY-8]|uniref:SPFH domain-containing protein n=1 Tax=Novosphingobium ovatum TaxID=1908523 RepID=A0ABW9XDZ1_9SPHN|nr:SPFH domain-containing protein [Novosphingobium ovatum]NBC36746.1 hypothetical protein [Novosphingobium ovatum]
MFDFLRKQFIDVIEWLEEPGQLAWRVPFADQEIQNGAQLTVREWQKAAFFNKGQLADVFSPGLHRLTTDNLPILTDLMNWDKAFNSPFKSDVVFFSERERPGIKWGTAQPLTIRDAEFGALRLRSFGTFSYRIADVNTFASRLLGSQLEVTDAAMEPQLRSAIMTAMATALGGSGVPFLDLASNQQKLSEVIKAEVDRAFAQWGLSCLSFFVENVSLPEEVQQHLDKGSSMRVLGDLNKYTQFQAAEAIEIAAGQDGGLAALGAGLGAAATIGGAFAGGIAGQALHVPGAAAPAAEDPFELLEKLHKLVTIGALTQAEFDAKKAEILARVK